MTNTKTELLLKALGIQNVFWIDDKFYVGSNYSDEQVRHAIRRIVFGSEPLPDQLRDFQPFREGQDEVFFADEVTNLIERLSQIGEGNQLDVLMEEVSKNDASNEEDFLGDKGFEKVQELLNGSKFESLSFSDWNAKKDTLPADNATLYLIDFENKFDFGAPGIGGKDVLNYLSRKKAPSFSVILTHVCDPHSETAKADEIFKEVAQEAAASVEPRARITCTIAAALLGECPDRGGRSMDRRVDHGECQIPASREAALDARDVIFCRRTRPAVSRVFRFC